MKKWWIGLIVTGIGTAGSVLMCSVTALVGDPRGSAAFGSIGTLCGCGLLFFLFMLLTSKKEGD